jgi:hypothetical protein
MYVLTIKNKYNNFINVHFVDLRIYDRLILMHSMEHALKVYSPTFVTLRRRHQHRTPKLAALSRTPNATSTDKVHQKQVKTKWPLKMTQTQRSKV